MLSQKWEIHEGFVITEKWYSNNQKVTDGEKVGKEEVKTEEDDKKLQLMMRNNYCCRVSWWRKVWGAEISGEKEEAGKFKEFYW